MKNLYLYTFRQGSKVVHAWHEAINSGEGCDQLEEKGIEVILIRKVTKPFAVSTLKNELPDLEFWLKLMNSDIRYRELQDNHPDIKGLTKIEL